MKSFDDNMVNIVVKAFCFHFRQLILAGVEINTADSIGYTPLHNSIEAGCIETSALLLKNGANPNVQSHEVSNCLPPIYLASKKELVRRR